VLGAVLSRPRWQLKLGHLVEQVVEIADAP
jgi:hypothetical protein